MDVERKPPERFGDVGCTASAENADGEIPQRRHHSGAIAGSDLGAVFVEGYVADPMESVFDTPLASVEPEDSLGGSLRRGEAGNTIDCLGGFLVFPEMSHGPPYAKDLAHVRELQVIVQLFAGPD